MIDVYEGDSIPEAIADANSGETMNVHGGVYVIPNSGPGIQIEKPLILKGIGKPIIYGDFPTEGDSVWDGIRVRSDEVWITEFIVEGFHSAVQLRGGYRDITISKCELHHNSESGVNNYGGSPECADYVAVEYNHIHHNGLYRDGSPALGQYEGWGSGITFNPHSNPYWADQAAGVHSLIRGNIIHDNWDGKYHSDGNGIITDHWGNGPPIWITENICYHNGGRGIHPFHSQNVIIQNNTCYHNAQDSVVVWNGEIVGYGTLDNITVLENIAVCKDGGRISFWPQDPPTDVSSNVWWGNHDGDSRQVWGDDYIMEDPMFVDPPADFRFQPGSPAIGKGAWVTAERPDIYDRLDALEGADVQQIARLDAIEQRLDALE